MELFGWSRRALCGFIAVMAATASGGQPLVTLASFDTYNDALLPGVHLLQGADGNFYGTTIGNNSPGTVFKMTPGGTLTTLYFFGSTSTDGYHPEFGLFKAPTGISTERLLGRSSG
jgi:uncharacterized repeat protein (TIGR03803 family)